MTVGTVMRIVSLGCAVLAVLLASAPSSAWDGPVKVTEIADRATTEVSAQDIMAVGRGQDVAVVCDRLGVQGAEVSVVMALDTVQGESPLGYDALLLTEETVGGKSVHFRIPNLPDLVDQTVTVRVYVTDSKGTTACNAGRMRIG